MGRSIARPTHAHQVAMKHSLFSEKPAYLLAFQAKVFHVKRFLVQENETRSTFHCGCGHGRKLVAGGRNSIRDHRSIGAIYRR
jgi:hypothetical protein